MPRVSVLLPARNAGRTVDAAVRSLLAQTFTDFELIAIDDGSGDDTGARLQAHARSDPRVRVCTGAGRGLIAALDLGVPLCRGEFFARMDADDESLPARLERSVAALDADPTLAGVGTGVEIFREDRPASPNLVAYGRWLSSLTTPERLYQEALVESPVCNPSTLVRRAALDRVGRWHEGDFPEDWQFWLRFLEAGLRLTCLPEVLHRWRDSDTRLTRSDPRYRREAHLALKAEFVSRRLGTGRGLVIWGAGAIGLALARLLRARGHRLERFVDVDPRKLGMKVDGVPTVGLEQLEGPSPGSHLLAAVGAKGARAEIRAWLVARGWVEGRDFTCLA